MDSCILKKKPTTKQILIKISAKTFTISKINEGIEASCEIRNMSMAEYFMMAKDKNLKILHKLTNELRGKRINKEYW